MLLLLFPRYACHLCQHPANSWQSLLAHFMTRHGIKGTNSMGLNKDRWMTRRLCHQCLKCSKIMFCDSRVVNWHLYQKHNIGLIQYQQQHPETSVNRKWKVRRLVPHLRQQVLLPGSEPQISTGAITGPQRSSPAAACSNLGTGRVEQSELSPQDQPPGGPDVFTHFSGDVPVSKEVANRCQYKCVLCPSVANNWKALCDHAFLKHQINVTLGGKDRWLTRKVLHCCAICGKLILCDMKVIHAHVGNLHGMKMLEYRSLRQRQPLLQGNNTQIEYQPPRAPGVDPASVRTVVGDLCEYHCHQCLFEGSSWGEMRSHLVQAHSLGDAALAAQDKHSFITKRIWHRCCICSKIVLCERRVIEGHVRLAHSMEMEQYLLLVKFEERKQGGDIIDVEDGGNEGNNDEEETSLLLDEANAQKVTTEVKNLCTFQCDMCPFVERSWVQMNHHLKEHGVAVPTKAMRRKLTREGVLHRCIICNKKTLCDLRFIRQHLLKCHNGMTILNYQAVIGAGKHQNPVAVELEDAPRIGNDQPQSIPEPSGVAAVESDQPVNDNSVEEEFEDCREKPDDGVPGPIAEEDQVINDCAGEMEEDQENHSTERPNQAEREASSSNIDQNQGKIKASSNKLSYVVGSRCLFSCIYCETECSTLSGIKIHLKGQHRAGVVPKELVEKCTKRRILFKCLLCKSVMLCDNYVILQHAKWKHHLSADEFRAAQAGLRSQEEELGEVAMVLPEQESLSETHEAERPDVATDGDGGEEDEDMVQEMEFRHGGAPVSRALANLCSFKCKFCGDRKNSTLNLRFHLKGQHGVPVVTKDIVRECMEFKTLYQCPLCRVFLLCDKSVISTHAMSKHYLGMKDFRKKIEEHKLLLPPPSAQVAEARRIKVEKGTEAAASRPAPPPSPAKESLPPVLKKVGNWCLFRCDYCRDEFKSWRLMKEHLKSVHKVALFSRERLERTIAEKKLHKCRECGLSVLCDVGLISLHLKKKHETTIKMYLKKFGLKFKSSPLNPNKNALATEAAVTASTDCCESTADGTPVSSKIGSSCFFSCNLCGKEYQSVSSLRTHLSAWHKMKSGHCSTSTAEACLKKKVLYKCPVCARLMLHDKIFINEHANAIHKMGMADFRKAVSDEEEEHRKICRPPSKERQVDLDESGLRVTCYIENACEFTCYVCKSDFSAAGSLWSHLGMKHKGDIPNLYSKATLNACLVKKVLYRCRLCGRKMLCDNSVILKHARFSHGMNVATYRQELEREADRIEEEQDRTGVALPDYGDEEEETEDGEDDVMVVDEVQPCPTQQSALVDPTPRRTDASDADLIVNTLPLCLIMENIR